MSKRPHRQSSAFDQIEVTVRDSADYPRVPHSAQKSPKGAAGPAQQVRKIEVFSKRLSVQKSPKGAVGLSVQKSPKGAAGIAQQVRKIEVFFKRLSMQKSPKGAAGLSVQKSPKGAAGIAQQVRKIEVFSKRFPVQKSPKGAAGIAQQLCKIEVFSKRLPMQKSPKGVARVMGAQNQSLSQKNLCTSRLRARPDQRRRAALSYKSQLHAQRGHHTSHWLNLRNDTHLPIVEQHYPQFLTLKKISQLPLTYTHPNRRGQQFSLTSPVHAKTTTIHLTTMTPIASRQSTHSPFRHRPSPPIPSTCARELLGTLRARRRLRCIHI
jgi:hypothetical protein